MWMLLAARSAVAWICIVFGLLIFLGHRFIRGRRRTFDRMRRRLEEADERCSFALATARSAGQELTALKLTHERLRSAHARCAVQLERCRSLLASARTARARRRCSRRRRSLDRVS